MIVTQKHCFTYIIFQKILPISELCLNLIINFFLQTHSTNKSKNTFPSILRIFEILFAISNFSNAMINQIKPEMKEIHLKWKQNENKKSKFNYQQYRN